MENEPKPKTAGQLLQEVRRNFDELRGIHNELGTLLVEFERIRGAADNDRAKSDAFENYGRTLDEINKRLDKAYNKLKSSIEALKMRKQEDS